jgi:hypothetical protein
MCRIDWDIAGPAGVGCQHAMHSWGKAGSRVVILVVCTVVVVASTRHLGA